MESGDLRVFVERGGRSILTQGEVGAAHVDQLRTVGFRLGKLEIRTVDGAPVHESPLAALLVEAGFAPTHKGLVLYPQRALGRAAG